MITRPDFSQHRVSDMLHTLRGEQFRHSQNVNGTRASLNTQSLSAPLRFLNLEYSPPPQAQAPLPMITPITRPEPSVPKSWQSKSKPDDRFLWRAEALSLIFRHRPSSQAYTDILPSLVQLCFRRLLSCPTQELIEEVVPCLPSPLRLELIRYAAIHRPLSDGRLRALLGPEGHTHGELLMVSSSTDRFLPSNLSESSRDNQQSPKDWDAEDSSSVPLQCLIILSSRLSISNNLTPAITHMTLVDLKLPISVHRLPNLCPLLVFLDLSYNKWLRDYSDDTLKSIGRVEWERWTQLRILGWRDNLIPDEMMTRLNKGRWDNVELIVQ